MSDSLVRLIVAGALLLHGLGHGGALGALAWIGARPGTDTGAWHAARSWLATGLPAGTATAIASAFWIVSLIGFVATALAFWGIGLPGEAWRPLAIVSAVVSMAGIVALLRHLADVQHARRPGDERRGARRAARAALAARSDVRQVGRGWTPTRSVWPGTSPAAGRRFSAATDFSSSPTAPRC